MLSERVIEKDNDIEKGHEQSLYISSSLAPGNRWGALYGYKANDRAGRSVSLSDSGTILAVGIDNGAEAGIPDAGLVDIYEFVGGDWALKGTSIHGSNGAFFGFSVELNGAGDKIAVGSGADDGYAAVYALETSSCAPTSSPRPSSSPSPTGTPSVSPSHAPSDIPSQAPSARPSRSPSMRPSWTPSEHPSL